MACKHCGENCRGDACDWCWYGKRLSPIFWYHMTDFATEEMRARAREDTEAHQRALDEEARAIQQEE